MIQGIFINQRVLGSRNLLHEPLVRNPQLGALFARLQGSFKRRLGLISGRFIVQS